ncbi:MAG TPA: GDSL-type esterase/lipase family protein, partial [Vicinamibacteria bacterium]|nr:GDSL-type esterase/lipase family protein [Vicinamibacteria bacterium]
MAGASLVFRAAPGGGPGRCRVPRRLDHPGLGRRARRGLPGREGGEPRHRRRHQPRSPHPLEGRRPLARPRRGRTLIGTNDLEEGATPETIAGNLKLILSALEGHDPKMPIVLCQVFPSAASKKRPADQIKAVNVLYRAAVKNDARVTLLETWPLFADGAGDAIAGEFPDLLHPSEAG